MKKNDTRAITNIGVIVAMTTVLSMFKIFQLPQGGSVTLGAMIPIMILAYCYDFKIGMIAGIIFGTINMIINPYFIHPVQVILDYYVGSIALGLFPIINKNKILAVLYVGLIGYISQVLSGVIFFATYANGKNVWIYSIVYNLNGIVNTIIAIVIMKFISLEIIKKQLVRYRTNSKVS